MPPKSPAKHRAAATPSSDNDMGSPRKAVPLKRKILRPKSPSPPSDVAESVVDDDTDDHDDDQLEGSEAANDSDVEFIDDGPLLETDDEEDPPLGIIPARKLASTAKDKGNKNKSAESKVTKNSVAKAGSAKIVSAKDKARMNRDTLSDDEATTNKNPKGKPGSKAVPKTVKPSTAKKAAGKNKPIIELTDSEEEELDKPVLDANDSMYPEPPASQKIVSKKRGLVTTPLLCTRAAASKTESPMESPTKKARIVVEPPQTPKRKASKSPSKLMAKLTTEDGDSDVDNPFHDEETLPAKSPLLLADLTTLTVKSLPDECEVDDENLHDPLLSERGLYSDLPNLLQCELKNAGPKVYSGRGQGRFMFAAWPDVCPGIKMKTALNIIKFVHDERYVNPSRVSPLILEARLLSGNSRYELTMLGQTAVCVSLIFVTESYIYETPPHVKLVFHAIKGTYHSQEFERFGGTMGMVTGQQVLGMQIWNDVVTFQTKLNDVPANFSPSNFNRIGDRLPAACFNTYTSPLKAKLGAPAVIPATVLSALDFNHPIPVYDARQVKDNFKWSADVFKQLELHFPRWDKEIPKFSCVIVGYIVNFMAATGGGEWKMYNNIQWAIMLGSPPA